MSTPSEQPEGPVAPSGGRMGLALGVFGVAFVGVLGLAIVLDPGGSSGPGVQPRPSTVVRVAVISDTPTPRQGASVTATRTMTRSATVTTTRTMTVPATATSAP